MEKPIRCAECGARMPVVASIGRPAMYCSAACRRAAEYELRRAQSLLTRTLRKEQDAALKVSLADTWRLKDAETELSFWRAEVKRLRTDLRVGFRTTGDDQMEGSA